MGTFENGIYIPSEDLRGEYIRVRMRERYPQVDDEIAVLNYGTAEEKAAHAEYRAAVKAEADKRYPKGASVC